MASDLDRIVEELQEQMWAGYSTVVIDRAQNPRNLGDLANADGFASVTGPCGDTMQIWLKVGDGVIEKGYIVDRWLRYHDCCW